MYDGQVLPVFSMHMTELLMTCCTADYRIPGTRPATPGMSLVAPLDLQVIAEQLWIALADSCLKCVFLLCRRQWTSFEQKLPVLVQN